MQNPIVGLFKGAVLSVIAGSCFLCGGCSTVPDGGGSPSPSVSWVEREVQDAVTLEVPKGWVLLDREETPLAYDLVVAPNHGNSPPVGVWIKNYAPNVARLRGPDANIKARAERSMTDAVEKGAMFHTVFLGSRVIGGSEAWGYSGMGKIVGQEDKLFPFQIWHIWREDGLWRIEVRGFEGAGIIPAELIGVLDTISFIQPAATPAAPYTVNTAPSSPEPSPSPTES